MKVRTIGSLAQEAPLSSYGEQTWMSWMIEHSLSSFANLPGRGWAVARRQR
jgi:hypothetical protein